MPSSKLLGRLPRYVPMIAAQISRPFPRGGWVYEEKIDGWRMLVYKDGKTVRLESRNGVDHTRRFRDVAAAVAALPSTTLVLDGEVAIFDSQLRSRFDWLREPDPEAIATPPLLMVFDPATRRSAHCASVEPASRCWSPTGKLAESHLTRRLFRQTLGRIERLASHPT